MADISQQVKYWRKGSTEDWQVGKGLVEDGSVRHGLFFVHLALEKIIKAHYYRNKKEQPPKLHNLLQLAELAGLDLNADQKDMLSILNRFCIECRYPNVFDLQPDDEEAARYLRTAGEIFEWLQQELKTS